MPEIGSTLVMAIATVAAGVLLGRAGLGAAALWVCAWLALILSGILGNQLADGWVGQTPVSMFFSDVLGTAFSALLLAGVYHRSRGGGMSCRNSSHRLHGMGCACFVCLLARRRAWPA